MPSLNGLEAGAVQRKPLVSSVEGGRPPRPVAVSDARLNHLNVMTVRGKRRCPLLPPSSAQLEKRWCFRRWHPQSGINTHGKRDCLGMLASPATVSGHPSAAPSARRSKLSGGLKSQSAPKPWPVGAQNGCMGGTFFADAMGLFPGPKRT